MKWFKHFTTAHSSNDLTKVRMRYGAEGYAIYWFCLEVIAGDLGENNNFTFELKHDSEVIGHELSIDTLKVEQIMAYMIELGLFTNIDGIITCFKLGKYLDKKNTRSPQIHEVIDSVRDSPRQSEIVRARVDKSRVEKKEKNIGESSQINRVPYQLIVDSYHELLPTLPKCQKLTAARKAAIKQRCTEDLPELENWRNYFDYVSHSDFLMGKVTPTAGHKLFRADLEWLCKAGNFVKVLEDKYHGI